MMENILFFIVKWFLIIPICIGMTIMPFYLLGAFIYAIYKDTKRALKSDSSKHNKHNR